MIYKISEQLELDFRWCNSTIANTSSLVPAAMCQTIPFNKMRLRTKNNFNDAVQENGRASRRDHTPHSLVLCVKFLTYLLDSVYALPGDRYSIYCEELDDNEFVLQFGMPEELLSETDLKDDYFDPDLEDELKGFLEDLDVCLPSSGLTIDHERLSLHFTDKMSLYTALHNYTSSDHYKVPTPDRYGFKMSNYDQEKPEQHLQSAYHTFKRAAKEALRNGDGAFLLASAPADYYSSKDHYLARACVGSYAQIPLALSQILVLICREEKMDPPPGLGDHLSANYNFN